jgi:hypothetical protein
MLDGTTITTSYPGFSLCWPRAETMQRGVKGGWFSSARGQHKENPGYEVATIIWPIVELIVTCPKMRSPCQVWHRFIYSAIACVGDVFLVRTRKIPCTFSEFPFLREARVYNISNTKWNLFNYALLKYAYKYKRQSILKTYSQNI